MTNYLHYPNSASSLEDIGNALCRGNMDNNTQQILHSANPHIPSPHTKHYNGSPIIIPHSEHSKHLMPHCSPQEHKRLGALSHHAGGAATLALAELVDELKVPHFAGDLNTFGGNGVGAAAQASGLMLGPVHTNSIVTVVTEKSPI